LKAPFSDILVKKFIKSPDSSGDPSTRKRYSELSSICGIFCNIFLFICKLAVGIFSASIAVISDAFNNLSDCASCILTLIGCRIAAKPADKEHPFGHGRMEYLTALGISAVIVAVGVKLLEESVNKILHPQDITINAISIAILILSVLIKLWMFLFNSGLGERIGSVVLKAVAKDSIGDAAATSSAIISLFLTQLTSLPFDGIAGALVSVLILRNGICIIRDTIDELLGKPADADTVQNIKELVCRHERILGVHDIIIHTYGPAKIYGSCHVEISEQENFKEAHDLVDSIERELSGKLGISMTIHMDPTAVNDETTDKYKAILGNILPDIDERLSFHDLRVARHEDVPCLIFDLHVPYELKMSDSELLAGINEALSRRGNVTANITIDRD
jgi:cation diffusion facilitator family transporter